MGPVSGWVRASDTGALLKGGGGPQNGLNGPPARPKRMCPIPKGWTADTKGGGDWQNRIGRAGKAQRSGLTYGHFETSLCLLAQVVFQSFDAKYLHRKTCFQVHCNTRHYIVLKGDAHTANAMHEVLRPTPTAAMPTAAVHPTSKGPAPPEATVTAQHGPLEDEEDGPVQDNPVDETTHGPDAVVDVIAEEVSAAVRACVRRPAVPGHRTIKDLPPLHTRTGQRGGSPTPVRTSTRRRDGTLVLCAPAQGGGTVSPPMCTRRGAGLRF